MRTEDLFLFFEKGRLTNLIIAFSESSLIASEWLFIVLLESVQKNPNRQLFVYQIHTVSDTLRVDIFAFSVGSGYFAALFGRDDLYCSCGSF